MNRYLSILAIISFFNFDLAYSSDYVTKDVIYTGVPVQINVSPGREILLMFSEDVSVRVPDALSDKADVVQIDLRTVSLKSSASFTSDRLIAASSKTTYLFDVSGSPSADKSMVLRLDSPDEIVAQGQAVQEVEPLGFDPQKPRQNPAVVLTRYVAQTLWAPDRLVPSNKEIRRVPVKHAAALPHLIRGARTTNRVLASWQGLGWYVTAVEVVSKSPVKLVIDPRDVRGHFRYITPQHPSIGPSGSESDRTTLYLISEQTFNESMTL